MIISLLLVLCLSPVWGQVSTECKPVPTDVIFVLDSSSSINPSDFAIQLRFVKRFIQDTKIIGIKGTQVGVYTFADSPVLNFPLGIYQDGPSMILAVDNIPQLSGLTNTDQVLEDVIQNGFSPAFGARPGAQMAVVLITDGQSIDQDKTIKAAQTLRKLNAQIFAIGVGNDVDKFELKEIASSEQNVYSINNYHELTKLEKSVNKVVCQTTLCSIVPVDVVFVLDSSSSLEDSDFEREIDFVTAFVSHAKIGPKHIQISLITFADKSNFLIKLNDFSDKNDLLQKLRSIQRDYGFTNTNVALADVRKNAFSFVNGGRGSGAKQVAIILTDGESMTPEATKEEARKLRSLNVELFSVGIGSEVDVIELHNIASNIENVRTVPDFIGLKEIEKKIMKEICVSDKVVSTPNPIVCTTTPSDVIFALDSSDSVNEDDFKRYIEFLTKFVMSAEIGPQKTQVGVFLYADDSSLFIHLDELNDKAKLVERIRNMKRIHGATYTDKALQDVRIRGFNPVNGGRGSKANQIAIVLTDGESISPEDTKTAARALRAMNVEIYAIGVGETNVAELHAISSGINNVFTVPDFKSLSAIEKELFKKVCSRRSVGGGGNTPSNGGGNTPSSGGGNTPSSGGGTTISPNIKCNKNNNKMADVVILLDNSDSQNDDWFKEEMMMVNKLIASHTIGPNDVQVAVVTFADKATEVFNLKQNVGYFQRSSGSTNTAGALNLALNKSFLPSSGARPASHKVVIVVTDGTSNDAFETRKAAMALRATGVNIFCIGIGNPDLYELEVIAGDPSKVFMAMDHTGIDNIGDRIFDGDCGPLKV